MRSFATWTLHRVLLGRSSKGGWNCFDM
jgi:hypothetical protein